MLVIPALVLMINTSVSATAEPLVVSPPIIMPQELVRIQERVLPHPAPVVFR